MTVSPFFNNGYNRGEQALIESMTIESIQLRGNDISYLPRSDAQIDTIMDEDVNVAFNGNFTIEMLTTSVESFQGDGHFMSQLGVEIRDQTVYQLSIRRFVEEANKAGFTNLVRPRESDMVYDPVTQKCQIIRYADKFKTNFQLGALYIYEIRCEEFEYSSETLNTGIPDVDIMSSQLSQDILPLINHDANGDPLLDPVTGGYQYIDPTKTGNFEASDDTNEIRKETAEILWNPDDPFSEGQF